MRVWDLPTRVFHWALALSVVAAVVSAKVGGNAMVWHMRCGLLVFALLAFRIVWGVVGGHWSRFARFVPTPGRVIAYLRGRADARASVGHSPIGALSVLAMLGLLGLQVATGLVADDEIATTGPLNRYVSDATAALATGWHKRVGQWAIVGLVALHLAAVALYDLRGRRGLTRAMWTGDKHLALDGVAASADSARHRVAALVVFAAAVSLVVWVVGGEL